MVDWKYRLVAFIFFTQQQATGTAVDKETQRVFGTASGSREVRIEECFAPPAMPNTRWDSLSTAIALLWCITKEIPLWIRRDRPKCSRCFRAAFHRAGERRDSAITHVVIWVRKLHHLLLGCINSRLPHVLPVLDSWSFSLYPCMHMASCRQRRTDDDF